MPKFVDSNKDEWFVELTVGMVDRVQSETGMDFDLLMSKPDKFTELLFASPRKLGMMLWVLCEKQALARGLDGTAFAERLTRGVLDASTNCILEAIVLFYPRSSAGKAIGENLPAMLAKMDKEIETKTREKLTANLANMYANSPVSSDSTPAG